MKNCSRILAFLGLLAILFSCGKNTQISGTLKDGAQKQVLVKLLDVNRFQLLDSVQTDVNGAFSYSLNIQKGQPEFIYLFYGDRQIASLLLEAGDHVQVSTDTLGAYSIQGSEESQKLQKVENAYNAFLRDMNGILAREYDPDVALSRRYVAYYRDRVAYVLNNCKSLTSVPVLFQQVNPSLAVFDQPTDGLLMRNICDSLKTVYPESRYVKALEKEAERRISLIELNNRLQDATEIGYLDISLPGMDGKPVSLSESLSKVTMLYFWSSTAEQKMFNLTNLAPLYQEFHNKGFQIYAVSLDDDKTAWATVVRNQNLPWVNVCDTRGALSPYVGAYGIGTLPMAWFIVDGNIDGDARVTNADALRAYLRSKL